MKYMWYGRYLYANDILLSRCSDGISKSYSYTDPVRLDVVGDSQFVTVGTWTCLLIKACEMEFDLNSSITISMLSLPKKKTKGTWLIKMTKKNILKTLDSQWSPSSPILINILSSILDPKKNIPIKAVIK